MGDQKLKNIRKVKETAHPGNSSGNKKYKVLNCYIKNGRHMDDMSLVFFAIQP